MNSTSASMHQDPGQRRCDPPWGPSMERTEPMATFSATLQTGQSSQRAADHS